jgi:hypothetical protein
MGNDCNCACRRFGNRAFIPALTPAFIPAFQFGTFRFVVAVEEATFEKLHSDDGEYEME